MTGEPTFFEIGVADTARARSLYGGLFGWRIEAGPSAGIMVDEGSVLEEAMDNLKEAG